VRFTDAFSLLGLSEYEIEGLTYDETDASGNVVKSNKVLPMNCQSSLRLLTNFFKKMKQDNFGRLDEDDILDTTRAEYKLF
jgi:hypothetical protein